MMKFEYEIWTEWQDNRYVTVSTMYAVIPEKAQDAIEEAEEKEFGRCINPNIIYEETKDGDCCSAFFDELIRKLDAKEYDPEEEYYDEEEEIR